MARPIGFPLRDKEGSKPPNYARTLSALSTADLRDEVEAPLPGAKPEWIAACKTELERRAGR
jgi:hypothetical protein